MPFGIRQHCHEDEGNTKVVTCNKVFVGIYLFIFSRFQICIFFTACNVKSQEYKLKQLYQVLSLDINTRKNVFTFKLFETINFLCFIVKYF